MCPSRLLWYWMIRVTVIYTYWENINIIICDGFHHIFNFLIYLNNIFILSLFIKCIHRDTLNLIYLFWYVKPESGILISQKTDTQHSHSFYTVIVKYLYIYLSFFFNKSHYTTQRVNFVLGHSKSLISFKNGGNCVPIFWCPKMRVHI